MSVRIRAVSPQESGVRPSEGVVATSPAWRFKADAVISAWTLGSERYFNMIFREISPSTQSESTSSRQPPRSHSASSSTNPIDPSPQPGADLTDQQKLIRMQGLMLNSIEIPVMAMWKDESVVAMNNAMSGWTYQSGLDVSTTNVVGVLTRFKLYSEGFKRELSMEEYPLVEVCRSRKESPRFKIGLEDQNGVRRHLDFKVDRIFDDTTGEFQGVLAALKDVTWYTDQLKAQRDQNQRQFQLICETLPQMVSLACLRKRLLR